MAAFHSTEVNNASTVPPTHAACQPAIDILSEWKIVQRHPLVSYWKDIVRAGSFVCGTRPVVFNLAQRVGEELVPLDLSADSGRELGPGMLKFIYPSAKRRCRKMAVHTITEHFEDDIAQGLLFDTSDMSIHFLKFRGLLLHTVGQPGTVFPSRHEGTLLVEVRSPHTGGSMSFNVDGETKSWDLSEDGSDTTEVRWCAFRNNVTYQIEPVTLGLLVLAQFDISIHPPALDRKPPREEKEDDESSDDEEISVLEEGEMMVDQLDCLDSMIDSEGRPDPACDCQDFLTALSEYISRGPIAFPLFHSYNKYAFIRPEHLKPVDRAVFLALLAAGYQVLLTPVMICNETTHDSMGSPRIGPCDPYDWTYRASMLRDENGKLVVGSSVADSVMPNVRFIFTGNMQATNFYDEQHDMLGDYSETKYYGAALVILQRRASTNEVQVQKPALDAASADITLVVHGERLPVHKEILCAHSPVFQAMFQNAMRESDTNEVVISEEFSVAAIQGMLHFLHSDAIPLHVLKAELLQLLLLAVYHQMPKLKEYVEDACKALINVHNVHEILLAAYHYDECAALVDHVLCWIADNAKTLAAENPEFIHSLHGELLARTLVALIGVSNQPRQVKNC